MSSQEDESFESNASTPAGIDTSIVGDPDAIRAVARDFEGFSERVAALRDKFKEMATFTTRGARLSALRSVEADAEAERSELLRMRSRAATALPAESRAAMLGWFSNSDRFLAELLAETLQQIRAIERSTDDGQRPNPLFRARDDN